MNQIGKVTGESSPEAGTARLGVTARSLCSSPFFHLLSFWFACSLGYLC